MRAQDEIQSDPRWARMYVKLTEDERLFIAEVVASVQMEERERCAQWHDHCAYQFSDLDEPYSAWHKASAAAIRGTS